MNENVHKMAKFSTGGVSPLAPLATPMSDDKETAIYVYKIYIILLYFDKQFHYDAHYFQYIPIQYPSSNVDVM